MNVKAFAIGMLPAASDAEDAMPSLMSNVKPRKMQMKTDFLEMDLLDDSLTLCWISIYLSIALPDASVDHEHIDGGHRFSVLRDDVIYEVELAANTLRAMEPEELLYALEQIVDRVRMDAGPGPIMIRSEVREQLRAA